MKKIAVLLVLFFAVLFWAKAQEIMDFGYVLEGGYVPWNAWKVYNPEQSEIYSSWNFYIHMEAEIVLFDLIFIGGSMRNVFFLTNEHNTVNFSPYEMYFSYFMGIRTENFEIGFRHMCAHPLMTYAHIEDFDNRILEGSYDEFYFKFKGKINIF